MKAAHPALKLSIAALILITIASIIAVILEDPAKDDSYHIVMYIMAAVILFVGASNIYGGFLQLQDASKNESPAAWYKQSRLIYGIFILLFLLAWLYWNNIGNMLPYGIQNIARIIILIVLGVPALVLLAFTMRNRSRL